MAKIKNGFVAEARKNELEKKHQEELKKKYNISENVKIVEKTNFTKFFINLIIRIFKTVSAVILCFLAVTGLISLVYPETREILFFLFNNTLPFIFK